MTEAVKKQKLGTDELLPRIEKALAKSKLSATAFGYMYAGDPTIIGKLRKGRRLYKLRDALEAACSEIEAM